MPDIFNRQSDAFGGSFSADGAFLTFASPGVGGTAGLVGSQSPTSLGVGLLTQSIQVGYQQQVLRLYEIGTNYHFYVAGRTSGNASVARVLGPRPISIAFYNKYGDVCEAATNILTLTMATGCRSTGDFANPAGFGGAQFNIRMLFCVITNFGFSMNAQDAMINENLQLMFCSLLLQDVSFAVTDLLANAGIT